MRPHGDPDTLAAAARQLLAAAVELDRVGGGLGDLGRGLAGSDAWRGTASAAYRAREGLLETEVGHAARALSQAGTGLSELSAGLADAQTLWDRASSLAASTGLVLDPAAPAGALPMPLPSIDVQVVTAARVAELAREAAEQAIVADRSAARRLAEAAETAGRVAAGAGSAGATGTAAGAASGGAGGAGSGAGAAGGAGAGAGRGEHEGRSLLGRALGVADRIGIAVGAGLAAIEARAGTLTQLVRSGREPAAALAAVRALAAFERSAFTDTLVAFLPLGGPAITLVANLVNGDDQGEPLLRALVRSLGESIGADVGQRVGMVACGAEAAATEGAGAILCPAVAIAATTAGATLGGAAAVRVYDALEPEPSPDVAATPGSRP